ncbi:MAG: hypothetical protein ACRDYE_01730 [Acidimicrobiales bacterium]
MHSGVHSAVHQVLRRRLEPNVGAASLVGKRGVWAVGVVPDLAVTGY